MFDPIQNEPDPCDGRLTEPNGDDPQQTDGRYTPALPVGTNLPALPHRNYLSIVNGSPYNFKLTSTNTNQMTEWEWHDIPAGEFPPVRIITLTSDDISQGESRQNMFEYRATSYAVDDKGEAYYEIEGTGKTFVVLIRTDYDNDGDHFLAKINYRGLSTNDAAEGSVYPIYTSGGGHGIEWVLTGSEDYGYWSSYNPPEAWMHSILDVIGDRKLKHVCMPGSHDAGIYKIGSTAGGGQYPRPRYRGSSVTDAWLTNWNPLSECWKLPDSGPHNPRPDATRISILRHPPRAWRRRKVPDGALLNRQPQGRVQRRVSG